MYTSVRSKMGLVIFHFKVLTLAFALQAGAENYPLPEMDPKGFPAPDTGCLASGKCHAGLEPIRAHSSGMAKQIYDRGRLMGDPNGCVICHGGNPREEKDTRVAHSGTPPGSQLAAFNRHAASMGINDKTCGMCHAKWVYATQRSVMQTEAGKIQGALWGWGPVSTGYEKRYGNYDIDDPDGPVPVFGTQAYKQINRWMSQQFPQNFPEKLERLPDVDIDTIKKNPSQAVYT